MSPRVTKLFFAPGNPGTASLGENVALKVDDVEGLAKFAADHAIVQHIAEKNLLEAQRFLVVLGVAFGVVVLVLLTGR